MSTEEKEARILDIIPEGLRAQLKMEVLEEIEADKKKEKAKSAELTAEQKKQIAEKLVDEIMPGYKRH